MAKHPRTADNALLRRLPLAETRFLEAHLEPVTLTFGALVCEARAPISHAVFPTAGVVSLLAEDPAGKLLEIGLVGRDGMFGSALAVGTTCSPVRAMVLGDGAALRIDVARFRPLIARCPVLRERLHAHTHRMLGQATRTAICSAFHPIDARAARWLLTIGDRMESSVFLLTQSLLADLLGVLRPTVSHAARRLGQGGLVAYRRGQVTILDRPGLVAAACSCYGVVGMTA